MGSEARWTGEGRVGEGKKGGRERCEKQNKTLVEKEKRQYLFLFYKMLPKSHIKMSKGEAVARVMGSDLMIKNLLRQDFN